VIYPVVALCFLVFACYLGCRVLMPLFAIKLGASPVQIGMLMALYAVFPLLLSVYAGRIADRVGSYRPVLFGLMGYAAGLAIPVFVPTMIGLYLSAMLSGLSLVFFGVATQNLISSIGDAAARSHNVSVYGIGLAASGFVGPMLTGYLIDNHGYTSAFAVLSALVVAMAIVWFAFRRRVPRVSKPATSTTVAGVIELLSFP
jgi:MFS family permease